MSNEIDSSMKLLPYVDDKFVGYRNKSVQDFRFALSEGIRDYISGAARMLEAFVTAAAIAIGVGLGMLLLRPLVR